MDGIIPGLWKGGRGVFLLHYLTDGKKRMEYTQLTRFVNDFSMRIYLHIPFCKRKCPYCKFALTPIWNESKMRTYVAFLENEIRSELGNAETMKSIYFGGGTPSALPLEHVRSILSAIRETAEVESDAEISFECNPEDVTVEYASGLKDLGITRVSLGVQSFNAESLVASHRCDMAAIQSALNALTVAGHGNVGTDFIVGLPHMRPGELVPGLASLLDRFPVIQHVSLYALEAGAYPKEWTDVRPSEADLEREWHSGREFLAEAGFSHYELSNFARPGHESRHNQGYWNHENYRGFGLAAASYVNGVRFQNASSFRGYYSSIREEEEILTADAKQIERIMFAFRTFQPLEKRLFNEKQLRQYLSQGKLREENDAIFLDPT